MFMEEYDCLEDHSVYDVFISYCPDAAEGSFVPLLQASLNQLGIKTFVLPTGLWAEQLPSSVQRAITYSKLDLVIFSVAYAASKRCLNELSIIGAKRGSLVLPLFYEITKLAAYDAILRHANEVPQFENWRIILSAVGAIFVPEQQCTNLLETSKNVSHRVQGVLLKGIQNLAVELKYSKLIDQLDYQVEELIAPDGVNNLLVKVPDCICLLSRLKTLNLSNCRALKSLPDSIGALFFLESMVLKDCTSLENLPYTLSQSKHMKHLNISGCEKLERLKLRTPLRGLDLHQRVPYLQHLEIDLDKVPFRINEFKALSTLIIHGDGSTTIPRNVGELKNLVALEIKNSGTLQTLPDTLGQLHMLAKLWIIACPKLRTLPNSICTLRSLESLRISGGGYLENLPQDFAKLRHSLKLLVLDISVMAVFPDVLIRFKDAEVHVCAVNRPMPWMTSSSSRSISYLKAIFGYMVDIDYVIQKKLGPNTTNVKLHIRAKPTDHDVKGLD